MVLSNVEIQKAIKQKRLVITPLPEPLAPTEGQKCPYNTSAVDLRLAEEIVELLPQDPHQAIDLSRGGFGNIAQFQTTTSRITEQQPYHLKPGSFVLARTLEKVELPLVKRGKQLAARIEGRSSFARCGLLVHFTAPTIHAGFAGTITLEMANFGPFEIILKTRMQICQLIVEEVAGYPFRNDSIFQGQSRPAGQRR